MNGRIIVTIAGKEVKLWFNNYSKIEIANALLPKDKGMNPRPEEVQLIEAINKMSHENYMLLLRVVVNAGIKGQAYGTETEVQIKSNVVAGFIASATNEEIYSIWFTFLQAYGFDLLLDNDESETVSAEEKKKK